jgi:xanthine dehydrogenase YagR molybdenum-binding subunit
MSRAAPDAKRNMGEPVPRIDGRQKVTGEALYPSDFPLRNPAFAYLVTSSIAKGRISQIDLAEAMAVPGVIDILTHGNTRLNEVKYSTGGGGGPTTSWQNLGPEIGHDGQIVGVVIADTFEAAREGAYRAKFSYSEDCNCRQQQRKNRQAENADFAHHCTLPFSARAYMQRSRRTAQRQ